MPRSAFRLTSTCSTILALFVACSSGDDNSGSSPYPATQTPTPTASASASAAPSARTETQVAQQDVGPAGGIVAGGGATIDIPPGAVGANTTIVIKTLTPSSVTLPTASGAVAGTIYTFEPDDVTFSKPVMITVALDAAKKPQDPNGVVVLLRSPAGANQWEAKGGALASATAVTATTDHFSDWAPAGTSGNACFATAACGADASAGGPVGIDCKIPASGGGVHCAGGAPPYACTCDGKTDILLTLDGMPSASVLGQLATACGASCPTSPPTDGSAGPAAVCPNVGADGSPSACEMVSPTCADGHDYAVRCQTATGMCSCQIDGSQTKMVTSDCGGGWDACGFPLRSNVGSGGSGDASTGSVDAGGGSSDGGSASADAAVTCKTPGADGSPGSCESISQPCTDGHVYGFSCTDQPAMCTCKVDSATTKVVNGNCSSDAWTLCGFPLRN